MTENQSQGQSQGQSVSVRSKSGMTENTKNSGASATRLGCGDGLSGQRTKQLQSSSPVRFKGSERMSKSNCQCMSPNKPEWGGVVPQVTVEGVCLDQCIVGAIKELWRHGINTRHSCCGHNRIHPDVGLVDPDQVPLACEILSEFDARLWRVWSFNHKEGFN